MEIAISKTHLWIGGCQSYADATAATHSGAAVVEEDFFGGDVTAEVVVAVAVVGDAAVVTS